MRVPPASCGLRVVGRPFELQEFGRRFGLHAVSDPVGQPRDM
jgi:hypothetical protein